MHYVYVSRSTVDGTLGCTTHLKERFKAHNAGQVPSTRNRIPLELVYHEASISRDDAFKREKYLKTTYGKRYIRVRCKAYFTG